MSKKTFKWNPEQNFGDDDNDIHIQCRKNVKLIDDLMKERLKSVSLVITTLLTSLHDTATEGMNQGFKTAVENFERITTVTSKIREQVDQILEILLTSWQDIIAVIIANVISVSLVLGLILATHIIMLIKALKQEEEDNNKVIKELRERWDIMESWNKNQVPETRLTRAVDVPLTVEVPKIVEIPRAVGLIPIDMGDSSFIRQSTNTTCIRFDNQCPEWKEH